MLMVLSGSTHANYQQSARQMITGDFVRRQLEALLHRVSCESLIVQPPHLRHLAIVRRPVTENGVIRYLHYSWDEIQRTIAAHDFDLSSIPGARELLESPTQNGINADHDGIAQQPGAADVFGFPLQSAPLFQVKGGEATFEDLIRATAAGDVELRNGDLVVRKAGTSLVLEAHEELPTRVRRRRAPPPPLPRRQATSTTRGMSKRKRTGNNDGEIIRGRPRKYLRGTEKFWRMHLKQARSDAAEEDAARQENLGDSTAKVLYTRRPADFDETLVEAQIAHLPVPIDADDLVEWTKLTRDILDRSSDGLFISPTGVQNDDYRKLSRVMVVKTYRLASLDFTDRSVAYSFRFISSSASHSFAYHRYYPNLPTKAPRLQRKIPRTKPQIEPNPDRKDEIRKVGPRLGVFYEEAIIPANPLDPSVKPTESNSSCGAQQGTTDDEVGPKDQPRRAARGSSTISFKEITPGERRPVRQHRGEKTARLDSGSAVGVPDTQIASGVETLSVRSHRKRKLTEKAVQLLGTKQGRNMRMFSETRSISSPDSTNDNTTGMVDAASVGNTLLSGIEAAAASPTPSGALPAPEANAQTVPALDVQIQAKADAPQRSGISKKPRQEKHTLTAKAGTVTASELEEQPAATDKRTPVKQKHTKGANTLCQRIILELIKMTNGVGPNDAPTLKRVAAVRWQEAGEEGRPLLKTMKAAVKSLLASDKLKEQTFSYRGKFGIMITRSLIFLPTISRTSQLVEGIKQKIRSLDTLDYIPSEWAAEETRTPLVNKDMARRTAEVEEVLPSTERTPSIDPAERPAERRRISTVASDRSGGSPLDKSTRSIRNQTKAIPDVTPASAASSFVTFKIPSLGSLPVVQRYTWSSDCPSTALKSDTSHQNPWRPKVVESDSRPRKRRKAHAEIKSIVWQNFPMSLSDILQSPNLKLDFRRIVCEDVDWQRFACEVECVHAWEEQELELALSKRSHYAFINHTVPEALYVETEHPSTVEFKALVTFDENGSEVESAHPSVESWPSFLNALQTSPETVSRIAGTDLVATQVLSPPSPAPDDSTPKGLRRTSRAPKRKFMPDNVFFDPALASALEPAPEDTATEGLRRTDRSPKPKVVQDNEFVDPAPKSALAPATKRRKNSTKAGASSSTPKRKSVVTPSTTAHRLSQGDRWTQNMSKDRIRRILVAVIVVRAVAGGVDGFIDWPIVNALFPKNKEAYLKGSWETLLAKHQSEVEALTDDFQGQYIEALETGKAPSINFEDIKATDWRAIVDWASRKLIPLSNRFDGSLQGIELPESRDELLEGYSVAFDEPKRLSNGVSHSSPLMKEDAVRSSVFGTSHLHSSQAPFLHHVENLEAATVGPALHIAKSWALAAILTPPSRFNPQQAQQKLSTLASSPEESEGLLRAALKLLEDEKLIQSRPHKRQINDPSGMRTWEAHSTFLSRFEIVSLISPTMLHRAREHKINILDSAFAAGDTVMFEKEDIPQDGEMVAVLNLMSMGQLRPRNGPDVPRTRYGLDHERIGYKVRGMDKTLLGFGVEIIPTENYVMRDPMAQARETPIPRGKSDEERGTIPPWMDIHGNLNLELWNIFLSGVMGLIGQMPGISAADVSRAFGSALDTTDVELVVAWAVQGDFLRKHERTGGYLTNKWWWLCVD